MNQLFLRFANEEDKEDVFIWRNDPERPADRHRAFRKYKGRLERLSGRGLFDHIAGHCSGRRAPQPAHPRDSDWSELNLRRRSRAGMPRHAGQNI